MNAQETSRREIEPEVFTKDNSPASPISQTNNTKPSTRNMDDDRSTSSSERKKTIDECPIFLRKTYRMIDTCDPSIAQWTEDGKSFVIKEPETLATKIIPRFFKHNNISSFVRQLNFYGFRKLKKGPIKINSSAEELETKYWYFRHEKFVRGRPDLLIEIRKPHQSVPQDQQEVDILKTEVNSLKREMKTLQSCVTSMEYEIKGLKSLVHELTDKIGGTQKFASGETSEMQLSYMVRSPNPASFSRSNASKAPSTSTQALSLMNLASSAEGNVDDDGNDFDKALSELGPVWPDRLMNSLDSLTPDGHDVGQPVGATDENKMLIPEPSLSTSFSPPSEVTVDSSALPRESIFYPKISRRSNDSMSSVALSELGIASSEKLDPIDADSEWLEKSSNDVSAMSINASSQIQREESKSRLPVMLRRSSKAA